MGYRLPASSTPMVAGKKRGQAILGVLKVKFPVLASILLLLKNFRLEQMRVHRGQNR